MSERIDLNLGSAGRERRPEACAGWALLLVDAAEGLLSEAEQSVLDRHTDACAACAQELAEAQRGAAWLGLLKGQSPEPPPALLNNILARTTGLAGIVLPSSATLPGVRIGGTWMPGGPELSAEAGWASAHEILPSGLEPRTPQATAAHGVSGNDDWLSKWFGAGGGYIPALQPRLAMTTAMAFFSICLTVNLLGFSVHSLRAQALRPAGLQRTVADTGASLVRSFEGIRVVYRVESRVNEWRTANAGRTDIPLDSNQ